MMEVYLAHTPYHLMLSVMNGALRNESLVFMLDMKGGLFWYSKSEVKNVFEGKFFYVSLGGRGVVRKFFDKSGFFSSICPGRVDEIINNMNFFDVSRVYVFNDSSPEVQRVLKSFPSARVTYIEDGSAPYNSHIVKRSIPRWVRKLIFGRGFDPVRVLGTSRYINDNIFTQPDLVRKENRVKPICKLVPSSEAMDDLGLFFKIYDIADVVKLLSDKEASLYLLPPHGQIGAIECYESVNDKTTVKMVKQHPLYRIDGLPSKSFIELSPDLPAELFLINIKNVVSVFGYPSTTLLFASYIRPDVKVYCVDDNYTEFEDNFEKNMKLCGVSFITRSDRSAGNSDVQT